MKISVLCAMFQVMARDRSSTKKEKHLLTFFTCFSPLSTEKEEPMAMLLLSLGMAAGGLCL